MILFGTRTSHSIKQQSQFNCPRCGMQRLGHLKSAEKYFTLYFIPLIPLGSVGEFVECTSCGGTYGREILAYDPQMERAQLFIDIRRILELAMVTSRRIDSKHVDALVEIFERVSGSYVSADEVRSEIALAQQAGTPLTDFTRQAGTNLNDQGRKLVVDSLAQIMSIGNAPTELDRRVLQKVGEALGVRPPQIGSAAGQDVRKLS